MLRRGYRKKVIAAAFNKARALDRDEALKKVVRLGEGEKWPKFVITFNPRLPQLWSGTKGPPTSKIVCAEPSFHREGELHPPEE